MTIDPPRLLLLANLALAFYLVGAIWAHEIDIFRSWRFVDAKNFHTLQERHWRKLPYWIFGPLGLALAGSAALIWLHPQGSPRWAIFGNLGMQILSLVLTAAFWGRWQGQLSKDEAGPKSVYLTRILRTHWIRTAIINAYAFIMLAWAVKIFA